MMLVNRKLDHKKPRLNRNSGHSIDFPARIGVILGLYSREVRVKETAIVPRALKGLRQKRFLETPNHWTRWMAYTTWCSLNMLTQKLGLPDDPSVTRGVDAPTISSQAKPQVFRGSCVEFHCSHVYMRGMSEFVAKLDPALTEYDSAYESSASE